MSINVRKIIQSARMNICNNCPRMTKLKFCRDCGCFLPAKTLMMGQKCPNDKWEPVDKEQAIELIQLAAEQYEEE